MAWRKRASRWYRGARSRTTYRNGFRTGTRKGSVGLTATLPFLAGVAVGATNLDDRIPKELTLGVACAPVRGIGTFKAAAQGVIIGNLVQSRLGLDLGSGLGSSASFKGV